MAYLFQWFLEVLWTSSNTLTLRFQIIYNIVSIRYSLSSTSFSEIWCHFASSYQVWFTGTSEERRTKSRNYKLTYTTQEQQSKKRWSRVLLFPIVLFNLFKCLVSLIHHLRNILEALSRVKEWVLVVVFQIQSIKINN